MSTQQRFDCPDCGETLNRRDFVRTVGGAAATAATLGVFATPKKLLAAPTPKSPAETAVKAFYESLNDAQRNEICLPFDHPRRNRINANWKITDPTIDEFFTKDQRALIEQIFRGVTSPDGYERFQKQMLEDYGGFGEYHVALFGEPGAGPFEWEMTGRHLTIRADGNSVDNVAFGGPIVYGHGTGNGQAGLPGNVFFYQTQKANEVFEALDGPQRKKALLPKAPRETEVLVQGESGTFPGVAIGALSSDQKELVESVIKTLLAPYRKEDVDETVEMLKVGGGLDRVHMAFYEANDLGDDQVWDIWRLEGPTYVAHFRGAPHVHAYINVGVKPKSA